MIAQDEVRIASLLHRAVLALTEWTQLDAGLQRFVEALADCTPYSRAVLYRRDDRRPTLDVAAAAGAEAPVPGARVTLAEVAPEVREAFASPRSASAGRTIAGRKPEGDPTLAPVRLVFPLAYRERVLGAVVLDDAAPAALPLDDSELRIIEALASQAAASIETARLFEEQQLRAHRLEAINEMLALATSSLEPDEVVRLTLDHIVRRLRVDMVVLWHYDADAERLYPVSDVGMGTRFREAFAQGVSVHDPFVVSIAFMARRAVAIDQAHLDDIPADVHHVFQRLGLQLGALLVLPVPGRDAMRGVITMAWDEPRWLDEDAIAFFSSAVSALSIAGENAELFDESRQRRERIEALHALTEMAISSLDVAETSERSLRYLVDELGVDMSALWVLAEDRQLHLLASANYPDIYAEKVSPLSMDSPHYPVQVLLTGEPAIVPDMALAPQEARDVFDSLGVVCGAATIVPVQAQGRSLGTLHFGWNERREISAADLEFYRSVANEMGIALENARLFEAQVAAERHASQELATTTLLLTAADTFAGMVGLDAVLFALGELLLQATEHTRVSVHLWDERRQELRVHAATGASPMPLGLVIRWDEFAPSTQEVLLKRQSRVVDLAREPAGEHDLADEHGVAHVLAMPIVRGERLVGLVGVDDPGEFREFSQREIDILEAIGAQGAIAIENARLFEGEHRVAVTLQHALLEVPEEVDGVEHAEAYRSATETAQVGGDFYDLFEISPGRVGVVIGDVSGKGLEAASMTAKVRDTLRVYAMDELSPAAVVSKTNDLLCRFTPVEVFVTLFFGTLDTRTGALTYLAAGHPAPLVLHEDGEVDSLVSGGPIVGAFSGVRFEEYVATFRRGDVLVLFTDGLVEARKNGEMYGQERAAAALGRCVGGGAASLPDLLGILTEDARRFADGNLRDDMALLAVRRQVHAD